MENKNHKKVKSEKTKNKKVLKIVLIVLGILLFIFAIHTIRNYTILTKISKNQLRESENMYLRQEQTNNGKTLIIIQNWQLDENNYKLIFDNRETGIVATSIQRGNKYISYEDDGNEKTMYMETIDTLDVNTEDDINEANSYNESFWDMLFDSMRAKIYLTDVDGKKCYVISDTFALNSSMSSFDDEENQVKTKTKVYIDKETGLLVKMEEVTADKEHRVVNMVKYEYNFNTVTEADLFELDASEYKLIENEDEELEIDEDANNQ